MGQLPLVVKDDWLDSFPWYEGTSSESVQIESIWRTALSVHMEWWPFLVTVLHCFLSGFDVSYILVSCSLVWSSVHIERHAAIKDEFSDWEFPHMISWCEWGRHMLRSMCVADHQHIIKVTFMIWDSHRDSFAFECIFLPVRSKILLVIHLIDTMIHIFMRISMYPKNCSTIVPPNFLGSPLSPSNQWLGCISSNADENH